MTRAPLYQLGDFQFSLPNGVPQTLDWSADFRWEEQGRLLRDPAQQFIGPGGQTITLDGTLFPGFSGRQGTMEQLRTTARKGEPLMLSDGTGKVHGKWVITQVREGRSVFMAGGLARKIDFNITLAFYGEDNPGLAASPLSVAGADSLAAFNLKTPLEGLSFSTAGSAFGALDWSQGFDWQQLTQQATGAGFSLGQLASIASTAVGAVTQIAQGDYVSAALGTFGLFGFDATTASGWSQLGVNAANLAEAYLDGQGPDAMGVVLSLGAQVGSQALLDAGVVQQQDAASINTLLKSTATLGTILEVDPKITDQLRNTILLP
jgi:uncharacterized protein